jgi:hypothetical protein
MRIGARHPWGKRHATVDLELVVDTDLHEAETREQSKWGCSTGPRTVIYIWILTYQLVSLAAWKRNRTNLSYSCRTTSQASITTPILVLILAHRPYGSLKADATTPEWSGCLLSVACGVVFERWVTPEDAELDPRIAHLI